jgi:hypothetical protein
MWIREHQRPWTLGSIVAADAISLKSSLIARLVASSYRRCWLVVGGDHGYWREERLCLRRGGTWSFVIDSHLGPAEPRSPAMPELIPELETTARQLIARDAVEEGSLHISKPGLLLIGADVDAGTMYGLAGYRDLLELYWKIRFAGRVARGTAPG